jgi:hypothetical protein
MDLTLIATYYAVEIYDNGIWRRPANWRVEKKWLPDRVRQLELEGHEVRVKVVNEYREEIVIQK